MSTVEQGEQQVVIKRTPEGMINIVMPPMVVGMTFMLLAPHHLSVNCPLVNSLAFHLLNPDVVDCGIASVGFMDDMRQTLYETHNIPHNEEGSVHRGNPEFLDGYYYVELHPVELAGVGVTMQKITESLKESGSIHRAPVAESVISMWLNAAQKFVTETEYLAVMANPGEVA